MNTSVIVPPFSARVLQHWFVNALWACFRTGAANSFSPWASSIKAQGSEEYGLVELIESAGAEEQVILLEALKSVVMAMIDEVNESFEFRINIFSERYLTFRTYLLAITILQPAAIAEVFNKALVSNCLADLQTDQGRSLFIALFWDTNFQLWAKADRAESSASLALWMNKYPSQATSSLLKHMIEALAK